MLEDTLTGNVEPSSPESQLHDQKIIWLLAFPFTYRKEQQLKHTLHMMT